MKKENKKQGKCTNPGFWVTIYIFIYTFPKYGKTFLSSTTETKNFLCDKLLSRPEILTLQNFYSANTRVGTCCYSQVIQHPTYTHKSMTIEIKMLYSYYRCNYCGMTNANGKKEVSGPQNRLQFCRSEFLRRLESSERTGQGKTFVESTQGRCVVRRFSRCCESLCRCRVSSFLNACFVFFFASRRF